MFAPPLHKASFGQQTRPGPVCAPSPPSPDSLLKPTATAPAVQTPPTTHPPARPPLSRLQVHYTSLMMAYAAVGDVARTRGVLGEMSAAGIAPNLHAYTVLVQLMGDKGERGSQLRGAPSPRGVGRCGCGCGCGCGGLGEVSPPSPPQMPLPTPHSPPHIHTTTTRASRPLGGLCIPKPAPAALRSAAGGGSDTLLWRHLQ